MSTQQWSLLKLFLLLETKKIEVDSIDVYHLPDFRFYLSHLTLHLLFPHLSFNIKVSCLLFSPDKHSYQASFPSVFLSISLASAIIPSFPSPPPLFISFRFVPLPTEATVGLRSWCLILLSCLLSNLCVPLGFFSL